MKEIKLVAKNNYLFREGDASDAMFIIKSGAFAVLKTKGNAEVHLADLVPGSILGEMGMFDGKPRSASIKALRDSEVICLPYTALTAQIEQLPVWATAILKSMNENLREANKRIKVLENPIPNEDRFPPHIINKYISILNLVGHKYGKPEANGALSFSSVLLRNYTIQIFQEATNKMNSIVASLTEMKYLAQEDRGDGSQKIINLKPQELFSFVDWHNDWLFKQEKDRLPALADSEIKILNGILHFGRKAEPNAKGFRKLNLQDVQNDSMKEVGDLIRMDDINPLIEKKYFPDKTMDEKGVYLLFNLEDLEQPARHWTFLNELKRKLR